MKAKLSLKLRRCVTEITIIFVLLIVIFLYSFTLYNDAINRIKSVITWSTIIIVVLFIIIGVPVGKAFYFSFITGNISMRLTTFSNEKELVECMMKDIIEHSPMLKHRGFCC